MNSIFVSRLPIVLFAAAVLAASARTGAASAHQIAARADSTRAASQGAPPAPRAPRHPTAARRRALGALADSIADRLTFVPSTDQWFIAAARRKRLLLDIGRVDMEVRKDSARSAAYRRVVVEHTPLPIGTRVRVHGSWGSDDAIVEGVDTWNGRIVAVLGGSPRVDSLARVVDPLVAAVTRADSARAAVAEACVRAPLDSALARRVAFLGDSLEGALRAANAPPTDRLARQVKSRRSQAVGCFGGPRAMLVVTLWAGNYEWVRERAVLVTDAGGLVPLRVSDLRFKAHELLGALDADGNGTDDVAARGYGEGLGGTVVLRLTPQKRLERLAAGFSWESR